MNGATVLQRFFVKTKTNDGEFAKQYNTVLEKIGFDSALVVRKLVYTTKYKSYERAGFTLLRKFNSSGLVEQYYSIKLSTLRVVVDAIDTIDTEKHSFARSQAIGFEEWYWSEYCPYYWMGGTYSHGETNEVVSTSELYELFLLWQKQQQEIKSNQ